MTVDGADERTPHDGLAGSRPNLVLFMPDQLRAESIGCYGHPGAATPVLDGMAAEGVLFEQAITPSAFTLPSHSSIMTGLYLQDHNVYSNFEALGNGPRTMAEILSGRGFSTFAVVNMRHLNPEVGNLAQGFQTYVKSGYFRRASQTIDLFLDWLDEEDGVCCVAGYPVGGMSQYIERMARFRVRMGQEGPPPPGQLIPMYRLMKRAEFQAVLVEVDHGHPQSIVE